MEKFVSANMQKKYEKKRFLDYREIDVATICKKRERMRARENAKNGKRERKIIIKVANYCK